MSDGEQLQHNTVRPTEQSQIVHHVALTDVMDPVPAPLATDRVDSRELWGALFPGLRKKTRLENTPAQDEAVRQVKFHTYQLFFIFRNIIKTPLQ
jgi:hypothetical protein